MSNWNVYRHDSCHGPETIRTGGLAAEPTGNGWVAVYRRERGRYPNSIIGLRQAPITLADLQRVGDRKPGEPRDDYDARILTDLELTTYTDKSLPSPGACVDSPYVTR
jgi:hypothetical protein